MFDHWDDTIQTGNDTEYGLVVLALCVEWGIHLRDSSLDALY